MELFFAEFRNIRVPRASFSTSCLPISTKMRHKKKVSTVSRRLHMPLLWKLLALVQRIKWKWRVNHQKLDRSSPTEAHWPLRLLFEIGCSLRLIINNFKSTRSLERRASPPEIYGDMIPHAFQRLRHLPEQKERLLPIGIGMRNPSKRVEDRRIPLIHTVIYQLTSSIAHSLHCLSVDRTNILHSFSTWSSIEMFKELIRHLLFRLQHHLAN